VIPRNQEVSGRTLRKAPFHSDPPQIIVPKKRGSSPLE
jgi:hypothetical protein